MILAQYTYQNVWYRDLSRIHLERAKNPEGNWAGRVVHAILGGIYAVPVVGDLVALVAVTVWLVVSVLSLALFSPYGLLVNPKSDLHIDLLLISPLAFLLKRNVVEIPRFKLPVITPTLAPDQKSGSFIAERGSVDSPVTLRNGWPFGGKKFTIQMENQPLGCSLEYPYRDTNIPIVVNSDERPSILEYSCDETRDRSAPDTDTPLVQVRNFSFEVCPDFPDVFKWKGTFRSPDKEFYIQRSRFQKHPYVAFPYPPVKVSEDEQTARLATLSLPPIQSSPESRHNDPYFFENRALLFKNEQGVMVAFDFATLHTFSWIPTKEPGAERPLLVLNFEDRTEVIHMLGQHFVFSLSKSVSGIAASINFSPAVPVSTKKLSSLFSENEAINNNIPVAAIHSIIFEYLFPFSFKEDTSNDQALMNPLFHRVQIDKWFTEHDAVHAQIDSNQARFKSVFLWGLFLKPPARKHASALNVAS